MISLLGTWVQNTAQGWLVLQLTDSPFLLGLVTAVQFGPLLFLSLIAGVMADRVPKRNLLLVTQTTMMLLALIMSFLTFTGAIRYWHIVILAFLLGTASAFDMPTRQSFIIEMVGRDDLMNAIALNSSIFNAARIVGPALAGLLIGWLGMGPCFLLNGLSYAAVIAGLLFMQGLETKVREPQFDGVTKNIREGLRFIRQTPLVGKTILMMAAVSLFTINFNVLIPIFARDVLGQQAEGYGLLFSAAGIGALGGALVLAWNSHRGPQSYLMLAGAIGLVVFEALLSLTRVYLLSFLLLILLGFSMIFFAASVNSTLQLNTPDQLRGRVMSVYSLVFQGMAPFGSLFVGSIAQLYDAPAALVSGAGMGAVSLVLFSFWKVPCSSQQKGDNITEGKAT